MSRRAKARHRDAAQLRTGFTTSACAAGAARAAIEALRTESIPSVVSIPLPGGRSATFELARCEPLGDGIRTGVIKDAGDDPDVTHGAEIQAAVRFIDTPGIHYEAGEGVGVATRPGLEIPVGEPSVSPGARRIIRRAVIAAVGEDFLRSQGVHITLSVPGGEAIAQETLNPRLGVLGGISILGTTGIVVPYSEGAYRGSIVVEIKAALRNGVTHLALTTGKRSESYLMRARPTWPELAFIQVGDHVGFGLKRAARLGAKGIALSGMIGKLSKIAQGRMHTHVSQGLIDIPFIASLAGTLQPPPPPELLARLHQANTARHIQMMLRKAGIPGLEQGIADLAAQQAAAHIEHNVPVEVFLWDIKGALLAYATA
ncbi:MAG TPA: cobalt-precorrin-5B (C(1))-methyltransferase [Anaerolineae bacterium]|nr:cobalt-precorrin-5B (C(1))-methyltransferase [Anaerolineae bacterium]